MERPNHREYKDAFLLQDINIKMHKMMVLTSSAIWESLMMPGWLNFPTTDLEKKKIPSDQNTENMKFTCWT